MRDLIRFLIFTMISAIVFVMVYLDASAQSRPHQRCMTGMIDEGGCYDVPARFGPAMVPFFALFSWAITMVLIYLVHRFFSARSS